MLAAHSTDFLDASSEELLPCARTPDQFAGCDAACLVGEEADDAGVEGEGERLGAVAAGCAGGVGEYGNAAAEKRISETVRERRRMGRERERGSTIRRT